MSPSYYGGRNIVDDLLEVATMGARSGNEKPPDRPAAWCLPGSASA